MTLAETPLDNPITPALIEAGATPTADVIIERVQRP